MLKKLTTSLFIALSLMFVGTATVNALNPVEVYAEDKKEDKKEDQKEVGQANGATNNFGVTMDEKGNLKINGEGFGKSQESAWQELFNKYQTVITGISGIATLAMVMFFIWNAVLLGKASSDPAGRQKAVTGLIWSGGAAMVLGSATLFVGVFYGMLRNK